MAEQEKIMEQIATVFQDLESGLNGKTGTPAHTFIKDAYSILKHLEFPGRKHEDWKYTPVQRLMSQPYKLPRTTAQYKVTEMPGLESYIIPVLNGKTDVATLHPDLSAAGIKISTLQDAMENSGLKAIFGKWLNPEHPDSNQAFEFLNFTFQSGGFFLEIPRNLVLDKPIEIHFIHDDPDVSFSHPLYFVHAGAGSSTTLIERFEKNNASTVADQAGLINALGYYHLDQNASIRHIKWQDLPVAQSLVYKLAISQEKDSRFNSLTIDFGGETIRNNVEVELEGSNTYTSLQAGFLAQARQSMDHQTRINHKVPHCESHELYKGIIDGQASAAFNGKVYVHPDAQKTNAYQQNDTLVLSPHAVMNSKPQLEIFADDVKCSHGATIGQLDDKSIFYLMARGLSLSAARHILKAAFLAQVLDGLEVDPLRDHIRSRMTLDI